MAKLVFVYWLAWSLRDLAMFFAIEDSHVAFRVILLIGPCAALAAMPFAVLSTTVTRSVKSRFSLGPLVNTKWIVLYLIWCGASLAWTRSDRFTDNMCILASMAGELLFVGLAMSVIANTERALEEMCWALLLGAITIAVFVVVNSDPAATERVGQGTISSTYFGTRIAFGAFACMLLAAHKGKRSRALLMVVLALLACGLVACGSKCSIVSFAVAIMVFIPRFRSFRPAVRGALLLGCIAVGSIGLYLVSGYAKEYQGSGEVQSLSGRTDLWPSVIQLIAANPIVGYGLNSFQNVVPANLPWESPHAHNEILQQWVTLGVVGVCLTVLIYVQALQKAVDRRCPFGELIGLIATFCVIRGMADPELWGLVYPLPMALMFVYSNRPAFKQSEMLPGADYPGVLLRKRPNLLSRGIASIGPLQP